MATSDASTPRPDPVPEDATRYRQGAVDPYTTVVPAAPLPRLRIASPGPV